MSVRLPYHSCKQLLQMVDCWYKFSFCVGNESVQLRRMLTTWHCPHLPATHRCCWATGCAAHTHTHTRLTALFPGLPGWASTRKAKPNWILLKQETVSGSGNQPCSNRSIYPAIYLPSPQQLIRSSGFAAVGPCWDRQMDRQDTIPLHRPLGNASKYRLRGSGNALLLGR